MYSVSVLAAVLCGPLVATAQSPSTEPTAARAGARAVISNVDPRRDTDNKIVNAHAGGIYNFSGTFYILGEHYRSCPHAGANKTIDPLAVGNCEMCGHTGTTFALYTSEDLQSWRLNTTDVIPNKPGGAGANLYTPVLAYNAKFSYFLMMYQCSGGCSDGQLQVATAATPAGPFEPHGTVLPHTDPRSGSSQGGIWVDESTHIAYFIFNSIGDSSVHGQWIVELDDTYLRMTNRSAQIAQAAPGSESGWLEGGGIFKRGSTYYYMAGSGCCYCAGGGGAMVFTAPHPLGPWAYQTNVNDALYLPFSPRGPPPPPPPMPPGPVPTSSEACGDLSGEWAMSVLVPNYQPLRAGLTLTKIPPPPAPAAVTISTADNRCLQFEHKRYNTDHSGGGHPDAADNNALVTLGPCSSESVAQRWIVTPVSGSFRTGLVPKSLTGATDEQHVQLVHEATGDCLDGALGKPGRLLYVNECVPGTAVGQTWAFRNASIAPAAEESVGESSLVNVASATCVEVASNSSLVMEPCGTGSSPHRQQQLWGVKTAPASHAAPKVALTYYNLTSTSETHWPAVPSSGWVLEVNELNKTVAAAGGAAGSLKPWRNPWANGQKLPAAPDCTMFPLQAATVCKLPYCGPRRNSPGPAVIQSRMDSSL